MESTKYALSLENKSFSQLKRTKVTINQNFHLVIQNMP